MSYSADTHKTLSVQVLLLVAAMPLFVFGQTILPSPFWKTQIALADDPFRVAGSSAGEPGWDFVGESINGTEDMWAICARVDYPHLAWEFVIGDFDADARSARFNFWLD